MVALPNIKLFEHRNHAVIFNAQDMTLVLLPLTVTHAPDRNEDNMTHEALNVSQLFSREQQNTCDVLPPQPPQKMSSDSNKDHHPSLDRLTLNVSNICNMTCQYCYAAGGIYYSPGMLMNQGTALNAINYVSKNFSEIRFVNFFGGEPTLNQPIIELLCEYIIYLHTRGVFKRLPRFGLTTNGYVIDSRMFEIIDAYGFRVSVSLDGPREIHDRLRTSKSGKGTYDAIKRNVEALIDMGIELEFECTYTNEHRRCDLDLVALMDFFYDTFHCRVLHSPMVVAGPDSPWFMPFETCLELYGDAIRYSIRNLVQRTPKSISIATRLLNSMSNRIPICHYCPAGKSTISINADGNVYACSMLMNGSRFCIGKVNEQENEESQSRFIEALLLDADKEQNAACQKCWAQPLCFGCIGDDFERKGQKIIRSEIPGQSDLCDYKRSITEVFLKAIAESYISQSKQEFWPEKFLEPELH